MAKIIVIDDDTGFRESLAETLADFGHDVTGYDRAAPAIAAIEAASVDLVFLDLRMPEMDGMAALRAIRAIRPGAGQGVRHGVRVVVLTAYATGENTIEAMRLGAFDHLTKPVGLAALEALLTSALPGPAVVGSVRGADADCGAEAAVEPAVPGSIIGASAAIREVQKRIGLAAAGDATVLVLGETGVGKELVAGAIHRFSARGSGPFVAVNCAAIPADLLESELFGHEKGAFTGAGAARIGRFREAEGGTLLLDEIGDMALATQAKMLRVLQERVVVPLGGAAVKVDIRLIAATHQDLRALVAAGRFRADLYYRLAVIPIEVPALRARGEDVLLLARHVLDGFRAGAGLSLTAAAEAALLAHDWPGNVRELRNTLERAASLTRSGVIDAGDLGLVAGLGVDRPAAPALGGHGTNLPDAVAATEIGMIKAALVRAAGNRTEAARALGISRQALYDRLRRYGLETMSGLPTGVGDSDAAGEDVGG